jgi:hypothetical protein
LEEQKAPLSPQSSDDALKNRVAEATKYAQSISKSAFVTKRVKRATHLRALSLRYRLGSAYQGEDPLPEPNLELSSRLESKVLDWKKKQIAYKSSDLTLTDAERKQLAEASRYPKYMEVLLNNPHLLSTFFKWSLLNSLSVQVYVEFPGTVRKIERSLLKARIGSFGGTALTCSDVGGEKDVTLLMEGKPVSILNGKNVVEFSHALTLTVDKIFKIFRRKNYDESYLTFFEDGIRNWDSHRQSPIKPDGSLAAEIDLESPDWFEKLPKKAHFTVEEASKYFGKELDGKQWGFTVVATRQVDKLNTFGAHSYFRLLVPNRKGGYDYTFGWGKFAKQYPQHLLHLLSYLCGTKEAVIEYPDNNEQYTYRQRVERHEVMPPQKGQELLESIRKDLKKARVGNLAFQILVHNCTDWVVEKMVKFVHEDGKRIFDMHFLDLELTGLFGLIVKIARKSSEKANRIFFRVLGTILFGHRKVVLKKKNGEIKREISIRKIPPYEKRFQHPGKFFRNLEVVENN